MSTVLDGPSYDNSKGEERPDSSNLPEPVRIIHKEQDSISAFCLNQVKLISSFLKNLLIVSSDISRFSNPCYSKRSPRNGYFAPLGASIMARRRMRI